MGSPWSVELWRLAGVVVLALVVGAALGQVGWTVAGALALYLGWQGWYLYRLHQWLSGGRSRSDYPADGSGVWGDITYRLVRLQNRNRKRKKQLGGILAHFRESIDALPDAMVVLGPDQSIEWWNKAAQRLLGLRAPQDTGQPITNFLRYPRFVRYMQQAAFDEVLEMPSPKSKGVTLAVRIVPYGKNQSLMVARDMTRLYQIEHMRRDFIANVSHELRSPLTVILGYLETLQDTDAQLRKQYGPTLQAMEEQAERMQSIVTDLLMLARLETDQGIPQRQPVNVPDLLAGVLQDAQTLSAGRQRIGLQVDDALWLYGNQGDLRSAFSNIVYNAVRYTPEGGSIDIRWFTEDGVPVFEVSDTGIGVAPQHLERLTERFYRVDVGRSRETGGTGLGLAIVKHVLNRHDAVLRIASEVGKGSTFRCEFPRQRAMQKGAA